MNGYETTSRICAERFCLARFLALRSDWREDRSKKLMTRAERNSCRTLCSGQTHRAQQCGSMVRCSHGNSDCPAMPNNAIYAMLISRAAFTPQRQWSIFSEIAYNLPKFMYSQSMPISHWCGGGELRAATCGSTTNTPSVTLVDFYVVSWAFRYTLQELQTAKLRA